MHGFPHPDQHHNVREHLRLAHGVKVFGLSLDDAHAKHDALHNSPWLSHTPRVPHFHSDRFAKKD